MATKKLKGLGRGLDALLGGGGGDFASPDTTQPSNLPVSQMQAGKYQPRTRMDEGALNELAASIKAQGLMQPILVRPIGQDTLSGLVKYEIIAGERRFRASQLAGLTEVPVLVRDVDDLAAAAMAPILGKLGGVIGRRKMLLSAMGLYTVGQALIAICPQNIPLLLVFRFMVGIGAAGIAPVVMSYIMMEFPPEKMGQGFTVYMAVACGMVIFGPTVGGIIMKVIGTANAWRIVMWVCVALCVITFLICFAKVKDNPNIPKGTMQGFDWAGAVFVLLMDWFLSTLQNVAG